MSPWTLLASSISLLAIPVAFRPRTRDDSEFSGFLAFLWYLNAAYCAMVHRLQTEPAPLPEDGPAILIANHTCNIDHFLLQAATGRKLGFMIARGLLRRLGVPAVLPDGRTASRSTATARTRPPPGRPCGPSRRAGSCRSSPKVGCIPTSGLEIGEGKPGVAFIATRAKVPVIPAYIRGTPRSNKVYMSFFTPSHSRVYLRRADRPVSTSSSPKGTRPSEPPWRPRPRP